MKIILETTEYEEKFAHKVEISIPYDDVNIQSAWNDLVKPALLAFGYSEQTISRFVGDEEQTDPIIDLDNK